MSNKIQVHKMLKKDIPNASYSDSSINTIQQTVFIQIKTKLIELQNEITDAVLELEKESKVIKQVIEKREKK
jgi:hypothetical protein